MPRSAWFAAVSLSCLLTACGGEADDGPAAAPTQTVAVTQTAEVEATGTPQTSDPAQESTDFSEGGRVEFRVVIGSQFEPCGDPGGSANDVPPAPAPSATGVYPTPAPSGTATPTNRTATFGSTQIPTPDCDQQRLDSLDCDAPPAPSEPDEVIYACSEEREGEGSEPGTPSVRYALSPARIVGVRDAGYAIPQGAVRYSVMLSLDDEGTKELARLSTELTQGPAGDLFAIVLDGVVLSAPYFSSTITDGQAEISGNFTEDEARELAEAIKSAG